MTTRVRAEAAAFLTVIICIFVSITALSQTSPFSTLQNVVPPSPEAISFARQNFADVNLYAGKHSYSIPLYTVSQNGITFPITLNYTGGGGIKVEEVASSVGLGWSLQYTGVITRVIKGRADDTFAGSYIGYLYLPGIDSTFHDVTRPDHDIFDYNYSHGKYDAQPDLYFINVAGISGSFYINKYKKIVFVEKSDLKIKIIFAGHSISGFEVTGMDGEIYHFDVTETTKTVVRGAAPSEYTFYDVSSWYLSRISNANRKALFTLEYFDKEQNHTTQLIRSPYQYTMFNQGEVDMDNSTYSELYTKRPLLKQVITSTCTVEFVHSTTTRYDLANDHYIDSIKVKNSHGKSIRSFNFDYSYFSATGVVQDGAGSLSTEGDPTLRLKLDRFEVISGDESLKEVYSFSYNLNKLLPDRLASFSMDHWGYYNGKTNTTWEPKHKVKFFIPEEGIGNIPLVQYNEFGTANREPDETSAQACILTEVTTPTGGTIEFQYEGHLSNDPRLPNDRSTEIVTYSLDEQKNYFAIELINEPFAFVDVKALAEGGVQIEYSIRDSLETLPEIKDTLVQDRTVNTYKFPNGTYYIKARIITSHEDPDFQYGPRLIKETETLRASKPVGGVRIKLMTLREPISDQILTRNYYYNESGTEDLGALSTGTIGNVPEYGYQAVEYSPGSGTPFFFVQGYVRQLSSTYPLVSTNGGYTGYNKVTVVDNDSLKSEYHFTSFNDFPECADGYRGDALVAAGMEPDRNIDPYDPLNTKVEIEGEWYESWPFAPSDERDHLRGKLKREVHYYKKGSDYIRISEKINLYSHNFGFVGKQGALHVPDLDSLPKEYVIGMVCNLPQLPAGGDVAQTARGYSKSYFLHTTKYDLKQTTEVSYFNEEQPQTLVTKTVYEYGNSPWHRDSMFHYQITKVSKTGSATTDTVYYYYPYDRHHLNSDLTAADTLHFYNLEKQNRISIPVLQKVLSSNNTHIASIKNIYSGYNDGQVYPSGVHFKDGDAPFEDRIFFNKYDTLGNILEQQKANDQKQSYLWGYKNSYVIAQVTNADYDKIAYTSFEPDSHGNWTLTSSGSPDSSSPTGSYSYTLSGNITRSGVGTGKFIVSYWKKSGASTVNGTTGVAGETINGWTYYEHNISDPASGTITVFGTGALIDELRLYPEGAQMTTYTHTPLVGVTSQCDANNMITTYEYDSFGRLNEVKDHSGNIVQHTSYHVTNAQTY